MSLAERLLAHAVRIMPARRRDWADGMRAELFSIEDPGEALTFAAGCILTAYQQRISPMRIALALGRFGVAAVTLLVAGVHMAFLGYWIAILTDLKTHGMDGWAGRFPIFRGHSVEDVFKGIAQIPAWHVAALVIMTAAFALCAWLVAQRRFKPLAITAFIGLAVNTANALAMQATSGPYLVHHSIAWLYALAFALLALAALAFWSGERLLAGPRPLVV